MYNRLYNYLSVNNILSSQFVFRSGASTEHSLLKFSDDILNLFDQKKVALLSKAFDWVDHNILYLNSNDMASMKLHCNGSIVTYQAVNILFPGASLIHLY